MLGFTKKIWYDWFLFNSYAEKKVTNQSYQTASQEATESMTIYDKNS